MGKYVRNGEILADTNWPEGMNRIAMAVEYKGSSFHGFQVQPGGLATVQGALHKGLSKIAAEPISLVCAGRTDAGVHATNQIVHFDTLVQRPEKAWTRGLKAYLPDDISVHWAHDVGPEFHARFNAQSRTYRYLIAEGCAKPALLHDQITWSRKALHLQKMVDAARDLVGEHDFTSYRAVQCQAHSPVRTIEHLTLVRKGELIVLEIRANAFLHHMVRNIVGVLMAIGAGEKPVGWAKQVLMARDRRLGGVTAPPFGLYLVQVDYDASFGLPARLPGPLYFDEPVGHWYSDE
ncbi:tRNA pseudouridine(38-40) synthase TruA [Gilvimarinus sp. SDUM040013]|uniref:tRNA pseudouridine synthase A n=1 Tax=Gilvimarinus gilvus TaxID=3058038 RepID=A0ABU4RZQ3_9GAMM|nr:tRNA pseudouridine(38-40) synthase TruA [Gilvimarinus sp. SDUM040013]MDO3386441.1 tRNA pseudouridine(38-40) synthase TruA [Gilvimarinus sp. SDUM040013]MDX6849707.1 tRNA pseudouridine(38-40) synthase TruA [Gilvimarinus sp. SDUM040013]